MPRRLSYSDMVESAWVRVAGLSHPMCDAAWLSSFAVAYGPVGSPTTDIKGIDLVSGPAFTVAATAPAVLAAFGGGPAGDPGRLAAAGGGPTGGRGAKILGGAAFGAEQMTVPGAGKPPTGGGGDEGGLGSSDEESPS